MKGAESNIIVIFYFSLVTEKAVAAELCDYLNGNEGLFEEFQSAYNCYHSTETARVRVHSDIFKAVESLLLSCSLFNHIVKKKLWQPPEKHKKL